MIIRSFFPLFAIPFFAPEDDKGATGVVDKPGDMRDDMDLMDSFIGDKDTKDMDEKEKKEEPEVELEEEPEIEPIEEAEIEPEIDTNARALDLKKIKEKYPEFAKTNEFRELRNSYHREAQYTELFPTIEDAKEAAENNETYEKLNNDLVVNGDPTSLITSLKESSPESYKKVATSFLDTIAKADMPLYVEVIGPVVRRLAKQINAEGQKYLRRDAENLEGKALVATARNIMQYAFEDADAIDKDDPKPAETSDREKKLEEREAAIQQEKFQGAYTTAANSVEHNLDKMILQGLDPDGRFNEFTRDTLLEKIKNDVKGQIDKDNLHLRKMTSLWKRASAESYNRESLSRIVSAYLERARPIIPAARNKFRSIAIKGKVQASEDKSVNIAKSGRSGRAPSNDGRVNIHSVDPKKVDYRNTSDDDIFNGKVKLKGS